MPEIRTDKFLKVSRLIKRRTVTNEACDAGWVLVNGKAVKTSYEIKKGDVLGLLFGRRTVKVEVLDLAETTKKEETEELFHYLWFRRFKEKQRRLQSRQRIFSYKLKKCPVWSRIKIGVIRDEREQ